MVVSGSVEKPLLGMLHRTARRKTFVTVRFILPHLRPFCGAKTVYRPSGVNALQRGAKRGELKYILLTESQSDGGMICALYCVLIPSWRNCVRRCRFTGTTTAAESYYRQYSAGTYAIMEGETEIYLTEQQALAERLMTYRCGSVRKVSSRLIRRCQPVVRHRARLGTTAAG